MPRCEPADHGGRGPKRLATDASYRTRSEVADDLGIALSELNAWPAADRDNKVGLRIYRGECCTGCGVHPSVWKPSLGGDQNAVLPVWKHCRVCELVALAEKAGPPSEDPGWHLVLEHNH